MRRKFRKTNDIRILIKTNRMEFRTAEFSADTVIHCKFDVLRTPSVTFHCINHAIDIFNLGLK